MGADHVGVALDDDDGAGLADGVGGEVESVEQGALLEDGRFGGVDIFGGVVVEGAAGEADAIAGAVADGEHEAVAETVAGAVLGDHDQAGLFELLGAEAERCEVALEVAVCAVGVAEFELGGAGLFDAALDDVCAGMFGGWGVGEQGAPPVEGGGVGVEQALLEAFAGGAFGAGGFEADAGALGEQAQGVLELDVLALLEPAEDVAALGACAEAAPRLALRVDDEGGGLFGVEGAAGLERPARFDQGY